MMTTNKVRKHSELEGQDEFELGRRIEVLREAVRVRGGTVLDIRCFADESAALYRAEVHYQVPMVRDPVVVQSHDRHLGAPAELVCRMRQLAVFPEKRFAL